jgi:hypothetical protein
MYAVYGVWVNKSFDKVDTLIFILIAEQPEQPLIYINSHIVKVFHQMALYGSVLCKV